MTEPDAHRHAGGSDERPELGRRGQIVLLALAGLSFGAWVLSSHSVSRAIETLRSVAQSAARLIGY